MRRALKIASGAVGLLAGICPGTAQATWPAAANSCTVHAAEAANRSGLSVDVILRVMKAESAGNPRIVSSKGAMGCMQIMPGTWRYLTGRYRLGSDPFDARMNMIGGAMYLAELASRYGWPGAFSAYNAGPGRYQRYVQNGAGLPAETIAYTARLGGSGTVRPTVAPAPRWQEALLFITRPGRDNSAVSPTTRTASRGISEARSRSSLFPIPRGAGESDGTRTAP